MAVITGWAHTKFGKLEDRTVQALIAEVAIDAMKHAEVEPKDVDAIYVGNFNGGFNEQDFAASLVLSLIHIPSPRDLSTSRMPSSA